MMASRKLFVTALTIFCISNVSASFIKKCKHDDSKCIKDSTQAVIPLFAAGLKEYKVKTLDPVTYKKIDASTVDLKLELTDITITGLKDCLATKVKRDQDKKQLSINILCTCQLEGQYEMKGKLLILPIEGKGPVHVTLRKADFHIEADMGEIEKGGEKYWDIKSFKHTFSLKDKSDVVFENLFNGNEILGQAAREMVANSGNEIILEVGSNAVKTILTDIVKNAKNFFHAVPAKDLEE